MHCLSCSYRASPGQNAPRRFGHWRAYTLAVLVAVVTGLATPLTAVAAPPRWRDEPPDEKTPVAQPLLPDLRTVAPADLSVEFARGGRRLLRLANLVWNSGEGPLELAGKLNPSTQRTIVVQQLALPDSDEIYEYVVGEFVYHPLHGHFHLEDFAVYEVWSLTPEGELHRLVASGDKLSYCLMETNVIDRGNPYFSRRPVHTDCGQETQGILPGWGDRYNAELAGQTIDITHLSNGVYALMSTANPTGAVLEANYTNNTGVVLIELRNTRVTILSEPGAVPEHCRATGRC